jgi:hypothetical protein
LKDTLLAFELERNEPLKQIAAARDSSQAAESMTLAQATHQLATKVQAERILASNTAYRSLKLTMSTLTEAKEIEKAVRSGNLVLSEAVLELDKLLNETEQMFFDAPGIESELAYHWFISETNAVCEELKYMCDKLKNTISTVL